FGPIRLSIPIAFATSSTLAPVFSQSSDNEFIEDTLCAKNALAVSFDNSDDQTFVVNIRSFGTQLAYTSESAVMACCPSGDVSPPMSTLSGLIKSLTAVPSAKNSGFESI